MDRLRKREELKVKIAGHASLLILNLFFPDLPIQDLLILERSAA
jgi:hypothetical protein